MHPNFRQTLAFSLAAQSGIFYSNSFVVTERAG
jgi:hypothetical protein